MQPCSREIQAMNSFILNQTHDQIPLQVDLQTNGHNHQQIQNPKFEYDDDFIEQMLSTSTIPSASWSDLKSPWDLPNSDETAPSNPDVHNVGFNYDEVLATKLRQHQISCGGAGSTMKMMIQQQMMLTGRAASGAGGGLTMPGSHLNDIVDGSLFKSLSHQGGDGSGQALFNGFGAHGSNQTQNFGATPGTAMNQSQGSGGGGTPAAQPKQRVRARRGQATDPHSIAERLRRERISERMKSLQELVPNANKTDKASMLDEIIDYVKFLQLQVKVLSMSRLGGAAAVAPLVADVPSEGGGDCIRTSGSGGPVARNSNGNQASAANDSLTVTEQQVAKLIEEDMGSAMQYLQRKGLCLMPISLATAISTTTYHPRNNPIINNLNHNNHRPTAGEGPSSPSMSVLTVQSASTMGVDGSVKDAASVSKP